MRVSSQRFRESGGVLLVGRAVLGALLASMGVHPPQPAAYAVHNVELLLLKLSEVLRRMYCP